MIDHDRSRLQRRHDLIQHPVYRGVVLEHEMDPVSAGDRLCRRAGGLRTMRFERPRLGCGAVPDRHRRAHCQGALDHAGPEQTCAQKRNAIHVHLRYRELYRVLRGSRRFLRSRGFPALSVALEPQRTPENLCEPVRTRRQSRRTVTFTLLLVVLPAASVQVTVIV
jgi:hypothetical protein